jgi:hypothetical protein
MLIFLTPRFQRRIVLAFKRLFGFSTNDAPAIALTDDGLLRLSKSRPGQTPERPKQYALKIAAVTTKVTVTIVVVDRIGWRTKVKARLLTGLLIAESTVNVVQNSAGR